MIQESWNCWPTPDDLKVWKAACDKLLQYGRKKTMDKSKLTIQRPKGCPNWAALGVLALYRGDDDNAWVGPYPLDGYIDYLYRANGHAYRYAKPYIKWQPETGEWVAFSEGTGRLMIGQYKGASGSMFIIQNCGFVLNVFRLVDDDGNLIDLRCTVEELKERTVWL